MDKLLLWIKNCFKKRENQMKLGDLKSSEMLIKDLYINLRDKLSGWAAITQQTSQARMGYIGQHLVSIATGFPGGKSGARGYDLVMGKNGEHGEIKTCYRVDQLGKCNNCSNVVAAVEELCSFCGSNNIQRKDDSKWLIGIRHENELSTIIDPLYYYLVLFDFVDLNNPDTIKASIYKVDTKSIGFAYAMLDYYYNIRANSKSKAPFNLWPYMLKFELMKPVLIYQSFIKKDNTIETTIFPEINNEIKIFPASLQVHSRSKNLTKDKLDKFAELIGFPYQIPLTKKDTISVLDKYIEDIGGFTDDIIDKLSLALYEDDVIAHKDNIPNELIQKLESYNLI